MQAPPSRRVIDIRQLADPGNGHVAYRRGAGFEQECSLPVGGGTVGEVAPATSDATVMVRFAALRARASALA